MFGLFTLLLEKLLVFWTQHHINLLSHDLGSPFGLQAIPSQSSTALDLENISSHCSCQHSLRFPYLIITHVGAVSQQFLKKPHTLTFTFQFSSLCCVISTVGSSSVKPQTLLWAAFTFPILELTGNDSNCRTYCDKRVQVSTIILDISMPLF